MRIAILDVCQPEPAFAEHGSVGEMTRDWLARQLPEATIEIAPVAYGADLPPLGAFDGFVVTGSEKGVYDEAAWMTPLRAFLIALKEAEIPVFGICFGHQIMADVWGGKAAKADKGFVIGARTFDLGGERIVAHAMHQDQVTEPPPDAEIVASAPYCPVAALRYDFPAFSIQFHPEYRRAFVEQALEVLDGLVGAPEDFIAGRRTMDGAGVSEDLFGTEAAAFFRRHVAGQGDFGST